MLAASIFFGVVVHAAAGPNIIKTPTLNGLVGYWSFNSADVSGTKAFDRSGGGNNATLVNAPTIVKGALGQALSLNGSNQYGRDIVVNKQKPQEPKTFRPRSY